MSILLLLIVGMMILSWIFVLSSNLFEGIVFIGIAFIISIVTLVLVIF